RLPAGHYRMRAGMYDAAVGFFRIADAGGVDVEETRLHDITLEPLATVVATPTQVLPERAALAQSYPNPFNPQVLIPFQLAQAGPVQLTIHDLLGQRVRTLIDEVLPAGAHIVTWDATDAEGHMAASGIYLYRLRVTGAVLSRRMVLLR
ncbi:MAG: T9SS type A sorting domain-containing protein, partial [bacterium]|nr:T9SS type A sorting domain-containing protein [bacterium]